MTIGNANGETRGGKKNISPASVTLPSQVNVKAISPKKGCATVGLVMQPDEAVKLATLILAVAADRTVAGDVYVTGRSGENRVTVIRSRR